MRFLLLAFSACILLFLTGVSLQAAVEPVTNAAGLKATVSVKKQSKKWLILAVTLENTGDAKIEFKNQESEKIGGFRCKVGDRDVAAEAGKWKFTKAADAKIVAMESKTITDLEVKFRFDPTLSEDKYDWSFTITNLFVDGKKIEDVVVSTKPSK